MTKQKFRDSLLLILSLCAIYWIALIIELNFVYTDELYYNALRPTLSVSELARVIAHERSLEWINFVIVPVYVLFLIGFSAICLISGMLFEKRDINLQDILTKIIYSQFVLSGAYLLIVVYKALDSDRSLSNIDYGYSLSLLTFLNINVLASWMIYPLSMINLIQVGYILVLSILMKQYFNNKRFQSLFFVVKTYGIGIVIWLSATILLDIEMVI